ncbi:MAG: tetratricopeptide repeat protein, partial [Bacteroidales bacterium]|nr:tetratricopeptide repeat protein [Bacteroidales bacterium]
MKVRFLLILLITFSFLFYYCGRKKRDDQREKIIETKEERKPDTLIRSENIITARTLGLAYLEDNKLDEAEAEFLQLITLAPEEAIGYANLGLVYLRMGKYQEAEEQLIKAIGLDPDDPDIRLNLAAVYRLSDEGEKSIKELEKTIEITPDHVQTLYTLAKSYVGSSDKYSMLQWEKSMTNVLEAAPANIVPRLHLIEVLLRNEKTDEALRHLEKVQSQYPDFPTEALSYYNNALESLHASDSEEALTNILIFHNFLKLTNPYQSGVTELKGSRGSSMGVPIITFTESARIYIPEGESILDAIRFTDVTVSAELDIFSDTVAKSREKQDFITHLTIGDFDHDGDHDIYLGTWLPQES